MDGNGNRHIGDDQLVYGLPKHMVAVAENGNTTYWKIVPSKSACATCRSLRGMRFERNPVPVHPNCACDVRRVPAPERQPGVKAFGRLQGHDERAEEQLLARQTITVELHNLGPLPAAIWIKVDQMKWKPTRYFLAGERLFLDFSKFGDTPMTWEVTLHSLGLDGSAVDYRIWG